MKAILSKSLLAVALFMFLGNASFSQQYVGAAKCKMCHNKPAKGEQYNKWAAGPHAKAMESLKGAEKNDPKCLKCHSTAAANKDLAAASIKVEEGVSCESCHGPGSKYKSMAIMKDAAKAKDAGLVMPDEKVCTGCHNSESPNFKGFDYAKYKAQIAHPNPSK